MSAEQQQPSLGLSIHSLRDLLYVVFRHAGVGLLCFLALALVGLAFVFLSPKSYRSEAMLLVRLDLLTMPSADRGVASGQAELNSEIQILRSRGLLAEVVSQLAKDEPAPRAQFEPTLPGRLRGWFAGRTPLPILPGARSPLSDRDLADNLRVQLRDSNVITASFESSDAETAREVLSVIVERYLAKHLEVHQTRGAYEFLSGQEAKLGAEVTGIESAIIELKGDIGVSSLEEERAELLRWSSKLEQDRFRAELARATSVATIAELEALLETIPMTHVLRESTAPLNPEAGRLREKVARLKLEADVLLADYQEESDPVRLKRREIEQTQALLEEVAVLPEQITTGLNENHMSLRLDLVKGRAELPGQVAAVAALDVQLAECRTNLLRLEAHEGQLRRLERELAVKQVNHERYIDNLEQARISKALEQERVSNISVVQAATLPAEPAGPGRGALGAMVLILAAVLALMLVFVLEFIRDAIDVPETLARCSATQALTSVPALWRWRLGRTPRRTTRAFTELREQIVAAQRGRLGTPVVAFSSAGRRAGVTSVVAGLGAHLAAAGERVLLVDVDFAQARLSRLAPKRSVGLSEALFGEPATEVPVFPTDVPRLEVLPAGRFADAGSERIDPERLMGFVRERASDYDYVLLDLPPITMVDSFAIICASCDEVFMIAEAGRTRSQVLQRSCDLIRMSGARISGAVLNKRRYPIPAWAYRLL